MGGERVIYVASDDREFDAHVVEAGEQETTICIDEMPGQHDVLTVPNGALRATTEEE